jgi:membrane-associated protein
MNIIISIFQFILHIDSHLNAIIQTYGTFSYLILFGIVFMETGFVITPFLPGDSLIFAAAALAASQGSFNIFILYLVLVGAAILGDTVNYWIGHFIGPKAFSGKIKFLKKEHLEKTHYYFAKYGGKTVILARFIPIVRTFAPFVAGVGAMTYSKFILYNVIGGLIWVALFTLGGYYFGNLPFVKHNFTIVIMAIIIISILPAVIEYFRGKKNTASKSDLNVETISEELKK